MSFVIITDVGQVEAIQSQRSKLANVAGAVDRDDHPAGPIPAGVFQVLFAIIIIGDVGVPVTIQGNGGELPGGTGCFGR